MKYHVRFAFQTIVILAVGACASPTPPPPPPPMSLPKFQCLTAPSGIYLAGTVVRTVAGANEGAGAVSPDELTLAWGPQSAVIQAGFADIQQEVSGGLSASLAIGALARLNATANLSADATYALTLSAIKNTNYVADDDLRLLTLNTIRSKEGLLPNARYFFIKEALGSEEITYELKNKIGVSLKVVPLKAADSSLSANVTVRDSTSAVRSKKELIACVVVEEMTVSTYTAIDGIARITYNLKSRRASENDLAILEKARKAN